MTLERIYLDQYVPDHETLSESTITLALHALRKFAEYLGHPPTADDLRNGTVAEFMQYRVDALNVKPITVNGEYKPIKALWNWLAKRRAVDEFPAVPMFEVSRDEQQAEPWAFEEYQRLLAESRLARGFVGRIKAPDYWLAFHHTQWDCEERPATMLALRFESLDLDRGKLLIPTTVRGHGRRELSIQLQPSTVRALRKIDKPRRKLLFGDSITLIEWRILYRQLAIAAGLDWERYKASPKAMLRQFALYRDAARAVKGGAA